MGPYMSLYVLIYPYMSLYTLIRPYKDSFPVGPLPGTDRRLVTIAVIA